VAETKARDAKLVQYLNEAYGKEKELETALQAHITMTTRAPYKKRLQEHLKETRGHGRALERRIKQLGGSDVIAQTLTAVQSAAAKGMATAKGPLHALRGTTEPEKMLKNAKTEYWNEAEEIATYSAIETLAEEVGDRDTVRLARSIKRDEERMARFLERLIPQLTKAVVREEVPSDQRDGGRRRRSRRSSGGGSRRRSGSRSRGSGSRSRGGGGSRSRSR
jgi:ferritin-like metal-binding protein YciE